MSTEELSATQRAEDRERRRLLRERFLRVYAWITVSAIASGIFGYSLIPHDQKTLSIVSGWWYSLYLGSAFLATLWFRRAYDPKVTWLETFKNLGPAVAWIPFVFLAPFVGYGFQWARVTQGICVGLSLVGLIIYLIKGKIDSDRETREELAEMERFEKMIRDHDKKPD